MRFFHLWHGWFLALFFFCAALVFSNATHWVLFRILRKQQSEGKPEFFGLGLKAHLGKPARAIFIITCLFVAQPFLPVSNEIHENVRQALAIAMVLSLGWFATGAVYVGQILFLRRYDLQAADNVQARRVHTQFQLFRRMLIGFIIVLTIGAALYTFHDARLWRAGTGLLASAGLASLVLATAAKSTASNFLAGLQIALTEPIRIDDVVIVQGEWGRIEEINSAYVVVRIWDMRRLIVPLTYFIENSFQNWTRQSADIMGTAFLYLDYTVPVEPLREHLTKIVSGAKQWDGKVCGLQVTDLKEHTMEIRCLMSSTNAGDNFDLRCLVREGMMAFVRENYPDAFPQMRLLGRPEQIKQKGRE
ncbi:mechanosensitive ion channel family protein [Terriglobus saanensis]|uniref:MscS Mechanosensitive ion channel n=1 Tax=Terriglobus saanensis (strain ATCC BAA-1853 / DSM 23119 / SP1PR4) TaxID=401053 RepID=E8V5Q7_TERSS|nr:mechanosensitive ion channel domain-containing protein [Terriglobus saanensis]ADV82666.1 MscS Mechanosensitive ion channel [Terriglobus saanensis SP1PR4]